MWGQQQQAGWVWPPPTMNYPYNNQEVDPSQTWAAAAALWAQQRQLQEQYQNGNGTPPSMVKPPEPPGPPPNRPPVPLEGSTLAPVQNIEVHDYMHGKAAIQTAEVVDYQHGKLPETVLPNTDVIDYNHGKPEVQDSQEWEVTSDNWHTHQSQQYVNGNWNQEGWNNEHWNSEQINYFAAAQHLQNAGSAVTSDYNDNSNRSEEKHKAVSHVLDGISSKLRQDEKLANFPNAIAKSDVMFTAKMPDHAPVIDQAEMTKRAKVLPSWLRQELEKLEKDKKKQLEKSKVKEESVSVGKEISGYNHVSTPSPEREETGDIETLNKDHGRHKLEEASLSPNRSGLKEKSIEPESDIESSDEDIDEEEQHRQLMLKVKTWMTEILLGVTNAEIKAVSKQVYVEIKRSAKAKATQLRKSGGLDALRSAGLGIDGDATTSDSEPDDEKDQPPCRNSSIHEKVKLKIEKEGHPPKEDCLSTDASENSDDQRSILRHQNRITRKGPSPIPDVRKDSSIEGKTMRISKRKFRENKSPASPSNIPTSTHIHSPPGQTRSLQSSYRKTSPENESRSTYRSSPENDPKLSVNHRTSSENEAADYRRSSEERVSKSASKNKRHRYSEEEIDVDARMKYKKAYERRKKKHRRSPSSDEDDSSDESESDSSSESEESSSSISENDRRTKLKHRRKRSRSRSRRSKKSKHRSRSNYSGSERRRKRRDPSSSSGDSSDHSYRRPRKSSGKKYKHRQHSDSRSPSRVRSKRKR